MAARCFGSYVLVFFLDLCGLSPGGFNEPCTLTIIKIIIEEGMMMRKKLKYTLIILLSFTMTTGFIKCGGGGGPVDECVFVLC